MAALIFWQSETFGDAFFPLTRLSDCFFPIGDEVAAAEEFLAPPKMRVGHWNLQHLPIPAKILRIGGRKLELRVHPARLRQQRGQEASANFKFELDDRAILPTE